MSRFLIVTIALIAMATLNACGNKGALYLPAPTTETPTGN